MKIAFIGTHGTGKTALCHGLAQWLISKNKRVSMVTEIARLAKRAGLPINEETTIRSQKWIILTQIAKEVEEEKESDFIVCDRGIIDNYAYLTHKFGNQQDLDPLIEQHLKSYDFLFKVPVYYPLQFDGVRTMNQDFQKEIDQEIDKVLNEKQVRHHKLSADQDFLKQAKEIIEKELMN